MSDLLIKMPMVYEPLRKNRWLFRFPSDLGIQEWWLSSASRPSLVQNEVGIDFLNTKTWVVGKFEWDPIDVTFRDPIGPSATQALMEWARLHSESVTGRQGYAAGYKRDVTIEMLDKPGQLKEVSRIIADLGANVIRVRHNQGGENTDINDCYLKITMETRNLRHLCEIKHALSKAGYKLTEDK